MSEESPLKESASSDSSPFVPAPSGATEDGLCSMTDAVSAAADRAEQSVSNFDTAVLLSEAAAADVAAVASLTPDVPQVPVAALAAAASVLGTEPIAPSAEDLRTAAVEAAVDLVPPSATPAAADVAAAAAAASVAASVGTASVAASDGGKRKQREKRRALSRRQDSEVVARLREQMRPLPDIPSLDEAVKEQQHFLDIPFLHDDFKLPQVKLFLGELKALAECYQWLRKRTDIDNFIEKLPSDEDDDDDDDSSSSTTSIDGRSSSSSSSHSSCSISSGGAAAAAGSARNGKRPASPTAAGGAAAAAAASASGSSSSSPPHSGSITGVESAAGAHNNNDNSTKLVPLLPPFHQEPQDEDVVALRCKLQEVLTSMDSGGLDPPTICVDVVKPLHDAVHQLSRAGLFIHRDDVGAMLYVINEFVVRDELTSGAISFTEHFLRREQEILNSLDTLREKGASVGIITDDEGARLRLLGLLNSLAVELASLDGEHTREYDPSSLLQCINIAELRGFLRPVEAKNIRSIITQHLEKAKNAESADPPLIFSKTSLAALELWRFLDVQQPQKQRNQENKSINERLDSVLATSRGKLALRDVAAFPATYGITLHSLIQMLVNFFLLVLVTFVMIDAANLRFVLPPYVDAHNGCLFEQRGDCCGPKINGQVGLVSNASVTELYASREVAPSCCVNNCALNSESFESYRARFVSFLASLSQGCASTLVGVGGARFEESTVVANMAALQRGSADGSTSPPFFNVSALQQAFATICPDGEKCQRFVVLSRQAARKEWDGVLGSGGRVDYSVVLEQSWRFVDAGCSRVIRSVALLESHREVVESWRLALALALICFGAVLLCVWQLRCGIISSTLASRVGKRSLRTQARSSFLFMQFVTLALLFLIIAAMAVISAFLSHSLRGILLVVLVAVLCCFFALQSFCRWAWRFLTSIGIGRGKHYERKKRDESARTPAERIFGRFQNDSEYIASYSGSRLLLLIVCVVFFAVAPALLLQIAARLRTNTDKQLENIFWAFETGTYLRAIMFLFQIAYAPIGLELLAFVPKLVGVGPNFKLRWLVLLYVFVFVWFPVVSGGARVPTTIDGVTSSVMTFLDIVTTDAGPLGSGARRLAVAFALLCLVGLFVGALVEGEAHVESRSRAVMIRYVKQCRLMWRQRDFEERQARKMDGGEPKSPHQEPELFSSDTAVVPAPSCAGSREHQQLQTQKQPQNENIPWFESLFCNGLAAVIGIATVFFVSVFVCIASLVPL